MAYHIVQFYSVFEAKVLEFILGCSTKPSFTKMWWFMK
jgi:hypothetical protein